MVAKTAFPRVQRKLEKFPVEEYSGVDLFAPHSSLKPGEMRECTNLDLFQSGYMRCRLGSAILNAIENTLDGYDIVAGVAWDTGADEYAVLQGVQGTSSYFISLKLERDATFSVINNYAGSAYSITGQTDPMTLQISGGRLFAFGSAGNAIIDWTGTAFKVRPMGLQAPAIDEGTAVVTEAAAGFGTSGKWTLGIEIVYRVNGADFLSSGINRLQSEGTMATFSSGSMDYINATVDSATIQYPAGMATNSLTDGLCVRLWRSKNQAPVPDDVLDIKDTFGLEDELYPIYLGTLSGLISGDGVRFTGAYGIYFDSWADEILSFWYSSTYAYYPQTDVRVATLDYLDLSPIPASRVGCQHKGRIWFSGAAAKLYYSKLTDTPYSELYSPQDFILCDAGDGQEIVWMTGMDKDLVIFKQGKTGRIIGGDPASQWTECDPVIGLSNLKLASYIPSLGIVAITGDQSDIKLFGYDLLWKSIAGDTSLARKIRSITKAIAQSPTYASFAWINGKLGISPGDGSVWMLHAEEKLGWTRYIYPMGGSCQFILSFSNGSRLAAFNRGRFAIEIETDRDAYGEAIDTDVNDLGEEVPIETSWVPHRNQSGEGRHMLEYEGYSIVGEFSSAIRAAAYSNGRLWPSNLEDDETLFSPDPAQLTGYPEMMEREYILGLKNPRPAGNFLHFAFRTYGPCSIRSQELRAYIQDQVRQDFDPFEIFRRKKVAPPWANQALCHLTFDTLEGIDYSGWARHHIYDPGEGGDMSLLSGFAPGNGARFLAGSGAGLFPVTWQAMEGMGDEDDGSNSRARSWRIVLRQMTAEASVIAEGGDPLEDANYWRLRIAADGSLVFESGIEALPYTFSTAAGLIVPGTTYAVCFTITNGGENGQFYVTSLSATTWPGARRTTRSALTRQAPPEKHAIAPASALDLTEYISSLGDLSEKDAKRYWQEVKAAD